MDCCNPLQLSAPQPAVDNHSKLERAFSLVIRQQAAAVHEAGRIAAVGSDGGSHLAVLDVSGWSR